MRVIGAPDNNPSESIIGHGHIFNKHMSGVFKLEAIIMVFPGHKVSIFHFIARIVRVLIHNLGVNKIATGILSRPMLFGSEPVLHKGMRSVVFEFAHWQALRTNSGIHTRSSWRLKQFVPHTKPIASRTSVPYHVV